MLCTDGGARGNPGPGAAGIYITIQTEKSSGAKEYLLGFYLGEVTNNQAEYLALIAGLKAINNLFKNEDITKLDIKLDSELIIKQLNSEYKVKNPSLKNLFQQVQQLLKVFPACAGKPVVQFSYIRREANQKADFAVNQVLDLQNGINSTFSPTKKKI